MPAVKRLVLAGHVRPTSSAIAGAARLGLSFSDVVGVVLALTSQDFYKSMTTHGDHRIWQDVYRPATAAGLVYLKITVSSDVVIVSFKEL
nr:type II toxin-antitoxin system MqsR family toxin [Pigmentiphaga litoralis]